MLQSTIDQYSAELAALPGARECIDEGFISKPLSMDELSKYAPGTLGCGCHQFLIENNLEENLGRNYGEFNAELNAQD